MLSHVRLCALKGVRHSTKSKLETDNVHTQSIGAKRTVQRREISYLIRSLWHTFGPRKKLSTPFDPSNKEVRFTRNNLWARSGPEKGLLLIGITEQAKELLRPYGDLELTFKPGMPVIENNSLGSVAFYHPDDVEKNRVHKEVLKWPIKAPATAIYRSINPLAPRNPLLQSDLLYENWLFTAEGLYQWDWDALLTQNEYLAHVERQSNLLGLDWKKSIYASPEYLYNMQDQMGKGNSPLNEASDAQIYEILQKQHRLREGSSRRTKDR